MSVRRHGERARRNRCRRLDADDTFYGPRIEIDLSSAQPLEGRMRCSARTSHGVIFELLMTDHKSRQRIFCNAALDGGDARYPGIRVYLLELL